MDLDIKMIEEELVDLEHTMITNFSHEIEMALLTCEQKHLLYLHREEIMGYQKSRFKSLSEGDLNTTFFHALMKCEKKIKIVEQMVIEDGSSLDSADVVHKGVVDFFQQLLSMQPIFVDEPGMNLPFPIISNAENIALGAVLSMEEVKKALWSIPQDSSPGSDGFSASFF